MNQTKNQPYLVWDTYEIIKHQAEYLQEEDPTLDDNKAFSLACEDADLMGWEWECLCDSLTEIIKRINPDGNKWHVGVNNFGWQHQSGRGRVEANTGTELLQKVLPRTECTFKLYVDEEDGLITINNAHHDAPMGGEMYYIRPQTEESNDA